MAFYRISQTQLVTNIYIVEANGAADALEELETVSYEPVAQRCSGDADRQIDGPYDTIEEAFSR
jgi:hypothetical protein